MQKPKFLKTYKLCLHKTSKNIEFIWLPSHIDIADGKKAEKYVDLVTQYMPNPTIKKKFHKQYQNYY